MARRLWRRLGWWLLGGLVVLVVVVVGGTWLYIHVIEGPAPAPLSLKSSSPAPSAPGSSDETASGASTAGSGSADAAVAGTWRVSSGSIVGYRVNEVLAGQNNVAVGRTSDITGRLTISGSTVTAASFSVPMDTIKSDESERDAQFNGRIMETATYPTGTLSLTSPIALGALPADGVIRTYHATADLTLHGHTRKVTFALAAARTTAGIEVSGSIPILFADWGIGNPSFAGFVTTQNHGLLEFLIKFGRS
ncbi:MAG TPA: YceI family protein [Streptosporangiaceae bacterium]|nr:YceI family protein [Streptosporangiaceae bacterium]